MVYWRELLVREDDRVTFLQLGHPRVYNDFMRFVKQRLDLGHSDLEIAFGEAITWFPNACVPIAGAIQRFMSQGVKFKYSATPDYLVKAHFTDPLAVSTNQELVRVPLGKLWLFRDSDEINTLVNAYVREVQRQVVCESGVLDGLTWCLNEVMDNVLQHSQADCGLVMGQIHWTNNHIAFCIYDYGQGIFNSLKNTRHAPRSPVDAITLAIKEGITRDVKIGQGNGMWGLHNIVRSNSGILTITSDGGGYSIRGDQARTFDAIPTFSLELGATCVDFQIDSTKGISIADSLGGHTPVSLRLEGFENEHGDIVYRLSEQCSGTGTRDAGKRIRNEVINLHNETRSPVELDFSGVSVVSSSFADELIGKLVAEYGFFSFNQIFRLRGMNATVQSIMNRSVSQRMAATFVSDNG